VHPAPRLGPHSTQVSKEQAVEYLSSLLCLIPILIFVFVIFAASIRILQEYERGVVFRLGRLTKVRGAGVQFLIPFVDRMQKVDIRVVTLDVPSQEAISRDNVTVKVNAVVYYRIIDAGAAIVNVEDYRRATWQIAQTSLRNVIGQSELDEILAEREQINQRLQMIIDEATEPWGVKVSVVEIKDVELPDNMKRAMARQAEAERERRAKIIAAEGEAQAAERLVHAAQAIQAHPAALQLRYLQTLVEIASENSSTVVFPLPMDLISAFTRGLGEGGVRPVVGAGPIRPGPAPESRGPESPGSPPDPA